MRGRVRAIPESFETEDYMLADLLHAALPLLAAVATALLVRSVSDDVRRGRERARFVRRELRKIARSGR